MSDIPLISTMAVLVILSVALMAYIYPPRHFVKDIILFSFLLLELAWMGLCFLAGACVIVYVEIRNRVGGGE